MKTGVSTASTNSNTGVTTSTAATTVTLKTENVAIAENALPFQTPIATTASTANKRPASLDLNKLTTAKKQRIVTPSPLLLETPDLNNIKSINTPDLEKILLSSNLLQTPQSNLIFPLKVTSEQEAFGKGFDEALHNLHNSNNTQQPQLTTSSASDGSSASTNTIATTTATTTTGTGMSGGSFIHTSLEMIGYPDTIKEEPQNPPASPPVSPIDMETQEKIKLERKRQRNRVAASKCRKRKLERISKLEDKVKILKGENTDLAHVVKSLKDHVAQLKSQVIDHIKSGCNVPTIYNGTALLQGK